jgi:hypothetical protein
LYPDLVPRSSRSSAANVWPGAADRAAPAEQDRRRERRTRRQPRVRRQPREPEPNLRLRHRRRPDDGHQRRRHQLAPRHPAHRPDHHNGQFRYSDQHLLDNSVAFIPTEFGVCCLAGQPRAIAFDPSGQTIIVGTADAGIFASTDGGKTWTEVPGSEQIPRAAGFFFDQHTGAIYVGSEGRGLWRITIPGRTGSN